MTYIKLKYGRSINSAHVISYMYGGEGYAVFDLTDGSQVAGEVSEDFEDAFYPIVPATAGFYAVYADAQQDLTRIWSRNAIVGWQITPGGAYPVVQGDDTGRYPVGRIEPDGSCIDVDGNQYENLDALKAVVAAEDLAFLTKAYPAKEAISTAFKITDAHLINPDGEKILIIAAHALEGGWSLPFGIVIESHDQVKQDTGQIELSALVDAIGITDFADEKQLIGTYGVIHLEKTGRERFSAYAETVKAA